MTLAVATSRRRPESDVYEKRRRLRRFRERGNMSDTATTPNVFVDTEVFDHHSRDFDSANLRILRRLASSGTIKLVLTTITEHEVRSHIDADAKDAFKHLQTTSRAIKRVLPDPKLEPHDEEAIRKDLQKDFDDFIKTAKIEILAIDDVAPGPIFKKYFERDLHLATRTRKVSFLTLLQLQHLTAGAIGILPRCT